MSLLRLASSLVVAVGVLASSLAIAAEPENTLILKLKDGEVSIALRPDLAPKHVEQIKTLVRAGEYDNVAFHRVIEGFMAQTGDVEFGDLEDGYNSQRVGTGSSFLGNLPAEFTRTPFERGTLGMARSRDPDSADSQFFIMFAPASYLNGSYTVIGEVESGMEFVDAIKHGHPETGRMAKPDRIISARIAAD